MQKCKRKKTESNHTDVINGVLRLESSGICIIGMGESLIFYAVFIHEERRYITVIGLHCY